MAKIANDRLKNEIRRLGKLQVRLKSGNLDRLVVKDFPFDRYLLAKSLLYRQSRRLYLKQGGQFHSTLVSAARTLSSPILLDPMIEYSPLEQELIWSATDPLERQHSNKLLEIRKYSSSIYHEQNHRILWSLLPSAPSKTDSLRRFLNFAESLVITLDMALGDELSPNLGTLLQAIGIVYDPGTMVKREVKNGRMYRNYLQAALHATYLNLELFDPEYICEVVSNLFPGLGRYTERAFMRSLNLNSGFISQTNLAWQRKHRRVVIKKLGGDQKTALELPKAPDDNRLQYMLAEKWFDLMGL